MPKLFDRVKVNIPTTGTGDVTFGAASSNAFLTPSEAGCIDGDTVRYVIVDGTDYEEGIGTIASSIATMARTTVTKSKIGGTAGTTKLNLSGTAVLALVASAADIVNKANVTTVGNALLGAADEAAARGNLQVYGDGLYAPGIDFNTFVTPGSFVTDFNTANGPITGAIYWYLEVINWARVPDADHVRQIASLGHPATGDMWARGTSNGGVTWSPWLRLNNVVMPGHIYGLTISPQANGGNLTIAVGSCADSTNSDLIELPASFTKIYTSWSVGVGGGCLDTGTMAISTWYHVFLIKRPDTGAVDMLISLSPIAPTLPTNYTLFRRIGSAYNDAGGHWAGYTQVGDEFVWTTDFKDQSSGTWDTTATLIQLTTPKGVKTEAIITLEYSVAGTSLAKFSSPDKADVLPSASDFNMITVSTSTLATAAHVRVRTDTSSRIRVRSSISTGGNSNIVTHGWIDTRGRLG